MALTRGSNRRIYDPRLHRYVTIPEVRQRLLNGEKVYCKKTKGDVTHEVLLRLIWNDMKEGNGPYAKELRSFIQEYTMRPVDTACA